MRRYVILIVLSITSINSLRGQYHRFSLAEFVNSAINPAKINQNNHFEASSVIRSQQAADGTTLTTSFVDVSYPFFSGKRRWSSMGLAFGSDRLGQGGIFRTDQGQLNYAITLVLSRPNIISIGTSFKYVNTRIDTDGLFTGSQFEGGLGFNPGLPSGELISSYQKDYISSTFGVHWKVIDKTGTEKSAIGVAISDFNNPNASFNEQTKLPVLVIADGSYRFRYSRKTTYYIEGLFANSKSENSTQLGIRTELNLYRFNSSLRGQYLNFITKYRFNEGLALGVYWERDNFSVGSSYEFPIRNKVSNLGTFEIALKYSKRRRPKRNRNRNRTNIPRHNNGADTDQIEHLLEYSDPVIENTDSQIIETEDENTKYAIDIEKPILLHFRFEFGSAEPILTESGVIEEIASILRNNPSKIISITGHTDNIGSRNTNLRLSFERAQKIYDLLVDFGVDPFQITVDGKGEDEPIVTNKTKEGRASNRRVEIKFH